MSTSINERAFLVMNRQLVVIPCHNEVKTLPSVLSELRRFCQCRILVVDDGSADGSIEKARELNGDTFDVITHPTNYGYGASLISGFRYAEQHGFEYLVTMDCDWQHEPAYVVRFFKTLELGFDLVSGSRYLPESKVVGTPPGQRKEINQLITTRLNSCTGWNLTDAFCGFKGYSVKALRKLELTETGYGFPLQLWVQSYRAGFRVTEIAVPRVYLNVKRSFGTHLDDPAKRLKYYNQVLDQEWQRESDSHLPGSCW